MVTIDRRTVLGTIGGGIATLSGCLGDSDVDAETPDEPETESGDRDGASDDSSGSAPPSTDRSLPAAYSVDELVEASRSGGPPPDGIPAIEDPRFAEATDPLPFLEDGDPVFGVVLGEEAKAYPQSVLVWHEIVNDVVGGTPVSVTYCPLTGTAQGFHRGDTTFGVSGQLINANLVMFDRATESWWPQILAMRITGGNVGTHLEEFQVVWTTWGRWRSVHPDTVVLTEDTGFARDYGGDPYGEYNPNGGYYADDSFLFPPLAEDDRLHPKSVVIGARSANGAVAVHKGTLRDERVVDLRVGGVRHVAVYDEALDTGYVYRIGDEANNVTGESDSDDADTPTVSFDNGSIIVDGVTHDPASLPFEREIAFDAMWFAWAGYYPMTGLYR